jgi:hypothetical protein
MTYAFDMQHKSSWRSQMLLKLFMINGNSVMSLRRHRVYAKLSHLRVSCNEFAATPIEAALDGFCEVLGTRIATSVFRRLYSCCRLVCNIRLRLSSS